MLRMRELRRSEAAVMHKKGMEFFMLRMRELRRSEAAVMHIIRKGKGRKYNMKKYTTIIFDLDGTLLYTLEDLKDAINYALECNGYEKRTIKEVKRFVGNGVRKLVERAVPKNTPIEEVDKVFKDFKIYYDKHATDKTKVYEGIPHILDVLKQKGYNLAIVSNKLQEAVEVLQKRFFSDTISIAVGDKAGCKRKPSPDSVIEVMKYFNSNKENTLYIGDSEVDIETAGNAGIDCISVSWGFREKGELLQAGATIIVNTPEELINKII